MNQNLTGRKILLGITASIAAYKSILLVRLLVKAGAEVKVVMTPAATDFVSPLVLSTLSKHAVIVDMANDNSWSNHVMLGRWADVMIIAPASCNTIAKMAAGICDNILMAVYLSATCPVMVAPAMDEDMWNHPSTQRNIATLQKFGNLTLPTAMGELASGLIGEGRMMEPEAIYNQIEKFLNKFNKSLPLAGKKAIVTAGPTYEPIDPVRFIGNHSSGLMGIEIAKALKALGAEVYLILGPSAISIPADLQIKRVVTAQEMFDATIAVFKDTDIAVMAAAVADFRPAVTADQKIKKTGEGLTISLLPNPDILAHCGANKATNQLVVGFALETNNEDENARLKLERKGADMIVMNSLNDPQAGFGKSTNKISIFESNGEVHRFPLQTKTELASIISDLIAKRLHEKTK